ncbi:MAG: 6-phosphogluconolactonase [Cetobacterium sp.]|uniref:6-phosphogluconolactonase n=2 Tax=Cetobacterium sp. TaxID=2071632 RepID=UPI002FC9A025
MTKEGGLDMRIVKVSKKSDLFKKAVDIFKESSYGKSVVNVAFSGGKTPKEFFKRLSKEDIDWSKINIFLVDERFVPLNSQDSNYNLLKKNLLDKIEIPEKNIHRIEMLKTPLDSKIDYEKKLIKYFKGNIKFDLVYLGIGDDGHTASIFDMDDVNVEDPTLITESSKYPHKRITLSMDTINKAEKKIIMATKEKLKVLDDLVLFKYPAFFVEDPIILIENEPAI